MSADNIRTLTERSFDDATRQGLVLVDFWAEWCAPCRALAPTVDALAADFAGRVTVAKLNVDEHPGVAARFGIRGIPSLLLFDDGRLADTLVGVMPRARIAERLERQLDAARPGIPRTTETINPGPTG